MALTSSTPDWVPADVFSPRRLLSTEPLFMTAQDSLWRIATSLCRQLKVVDRQITESLALRGSSRARSRAAPRNVTQMMRAVPRDTSPGSSIDATLLRELDNFSDFSRDELDQMLAAATRCDLPKGRLLFREGDPGDSCFILVRGQVDVTIKVRQQRHLLAQLSPGKIFGQVSLVAGEPRSATCTIRRDAVLAQLNRDACEKLLSTQGPVALKFLAALNRGLTEALRTAVTGFKSRCRTVPLPAGPGRAPSFNGGRLIAIATRIGDVGNSGRASPLISIRTPKQDVCHGNLERIDHPHQGSDDHEPGARSEERARLPSGRCTVDGSATGAA